MQCRQSLRWKMAESSAAKATARKAECYGEVVFNTSITGYQEIFTDPSYAGQIVVLTNPEIGNYGTNSEDNEAIRPYIEGLVVREFSRVSSNWRSQEVAEEYLERYKVPVLAEIDTRALVRHLRTHGVMRGVISTLESDTEKADRLVRAPSRRRGWHLDLAKRDHHAQRLPVGRGRALARAHRNCGRERCAAEAPRRRAYGLLVSSTTFCGGW